MICESITYVKSSLPCNNIDVHEHLTEIAMPFDTRCSDRDACRTGFNRPTSPMTPCRVSTTAETRNMSLELTY